MKHIMLDFETLDTAPTAAVLSFGAVKFDPFTGQTSEQFYCNFSLEDCLAYNRTISPSTLMWWMSQSEAARNMVFDQTRALSLDGFTTAFSKWCGPAHDIEGVWANGSDFDLPIVKSIYDDVAKALPWEYFKHRDQRTLRSLNPMASKLAKSVKFDGVKHNPLDDCLHQVKVLHTVLSKCWR